MLGNTAGCVELILIIWRGRPRPRDLPQHADSGFCFFQDFPDLHRRDSCIAKNLSQRCPIRRGNQQPSRGLRIEQQRPQILGNALKVLGSADHFARNEKSADYQGDSDFGAAVAGVCHVHQYLKKPVQLCRAQLLRLRLFTMLVSHPSDCNADGKNGCEHAGPSDPLAALTICKTTPISFCDIMNRWASPPACWKPSSKSALISPGRTLNRCCCTTCGNLGRSRLARANRAQWRPRRVPSPAPEKRDRPWRRCFPCGDSSRRQASELRGNHDLQGLSSKSRSG